MLSLSGDNQSDVIEAFISTSRYLDDIYNIDNNFLIAWSTIFTQIWPTCQIPRPHFLDLHLSISGGGWFCQD